MEKKQTKVLVTGFGPFPGQKKNPSATLVRALAKDFGKAVDIKCVVLPTEYKAGLARFQKELKSYKPDFVLCFGVAAKRHKICLEGTARNKRNTSAADAAGYKPRVAHISKSGAETYKATLPLKALEQSLKEKGVPVRVSHDAGDYLCNFTFYHLMKYAEEKAPHIKGGFIHIPDPEKGRVSQKQIQSAARIIIRNVLSM